MLVANAAASRPEITFSVSEHQRFVGTCLCCQRSVTARLPKEIPSGQRGPGLIAWIALISGHFRLSTRSIQSLLEMQWGLHFSTGTISEVQEPVAEWLEPVVDHIADTVRQAPVAQQLHEDFSGILVTDRHGAHGIHPQAQRPLCWAHVIRNLERLSGRTGEPRALGL